MELINREFKAVVQDTTHVFVGAKMSVSEMMSFDDVPFKIKAIFNKYYSKEDQINRPIGELLGQIDKNSFEFQVFKQLRLKFKAGEYIEKRGKKIYKSKSLSLDEFIDLHASGKEYVDEEVVFNKLALLAFST
ncbi:MAG: hypothetical protein MJ126_06570 [Lachnospiraceae bacterium]|nr:hypothetical protein [Lachnospiraceae bacterium]